MRFWTVLSARAPVTTERRSGESPADRTSDHRRVVGLRGAGRMELRASPVGASPDDNFHMTSIWCAQGERADMCESTGVAGERAVLDEVANSSVCFAFVPEHSGRCDTQRSGLIVTGHGNFKGLYPRSSIPRLHHLHLGCADSVLIMRLFNLSSPLHSSPSVYVFVDRKLRAPMLWGLLLTTVPTGVFLIASVNPSGWAIVSAGTLWVALAGYLRAPTWTRRIRSRRPGARRRGDGRRSPR